MRQIRLLHISDTHFGKHHRCSPEDKTLAKAGYPSLFELLARDLESGVFDHEGWRASSDDDGKELNPLIVLVTGDLTEHASPGEFRQAHDFLTRFDGASVLGSKLTRRDIFIVPGNHDVAYAGNDDEERLTPYANFYSKLFRDVRTPVAADQARALTQVRVDAERGFLVAEIDSAFYVKKDTEEEQRGQVDMESIKRLREQLTEARTKPDFSSLIRVAILHHHPVLVPALVEPDRGYDAVANSHHLLRLLRDFGFQLVLHGHKHFPLVFSYDSDAPWNPEIAPSMLVASGGSAGSRELPKGTSSCNSYNLLSIKWHPEVSQARVRFVTRGLRALDDANELPPDQWSWRTLREVDRRLYPPREPPKPAYPRLLAPTDGKEDIRRAAYQATRLNMVVSDVLPSLHPDQAYEVRLWVVPHVDLDGHPKPGWEPPERVVWSAGDYFDVVECRREDDDVFACAVSYWGPMLVQAEMFFADGHRGYAHAYARIPGLGARGETVRPSD
jgi:3',5'-cyclic AMP phosphodiesterase CpdA